MPGACKLDTMLPALWTNRPNRVTQWRALSAAGCIKPTEADQLFRPEPRWESYN